MRIYLPWTNTTRLSYFSTLVLSVHLYHHCLWWKDIRKKRKAPQPSTLMLAVLSSLRFLSHLTLNRSCYTAQSNFITRIIEDLKKKSQFFTLIKNIYQFLAPPLAWSAAEHYPKQRTGVSPLFELGMEMLHPCRDCAGPDKIHRWDESGCASWNICAAAEAQPFLGAGVEPQSGAAAARKSWPEWVVDVGISRDDLWQWQDAEQRTKVWEITLTNHSIPSVDRTISSFLEK